MPPNGRSRQNTRVACNGCRSSRMRCDGARPCCSRCTQRSQRCVYETATITESRRANFRRSHQVHDQLLVDLRSSLDSLRNAPDEEVLRALRRITSSGDPLGTLATLGSMRRLPLTPSAHDMTGSIFPDSLLPFQYELMMQHPHAYPVVHPLVHVGGEMSALEPSNRRLIASDPHQTDKRFDKLRIERWTTVEIDDEDAVNLITHYLETDHPILGLFDADLFLTDLTEGRERFCSSFLVNCVLFWACLSCSSNNPTAVSLKPHFYEEAETLWATARETDDTRTVAATQIFSLGCACDSNDVLATDLKTAGHDMGIRLGLFSHEARAAIASEDMDVRRWKSHVAWGVYNWLCLHGFYYRQPPIGDPPWLLIPSEKDEDTDEVLTDPSSPFMVRTIPSLCKFWRTLKPIIDLFVLGDPRLPLSQRMTLATAEGAFQELLSWADDNLLKFGNNGTLDKPHHVLVMHIWFHTAIMEIFRPFYGKNWTLRTFDTRHSTPEVIFWSSLTQLERLALEYRQNHPSASTSILWHLSLLFIANAVVCNPIGSTWRFNFMLCMHGYVELAGSFRVADGFLRAIVYMAVQKKVISPAEARSIIGRLPKVNSPGFVDTAADVPRIRSTHVADFELALNDESVSHVADLAEKLEDALLFDDFVESEKTQGSESS